MVVTFSEKSGIIHKNASFCRVRGFPLTSAYLLSFVNILKFSSYTSMQILSFTACQTFSA